MNHNNTFRLYLDSILLAFFIHRMANALFTMLSPEMSPTVQSAMFSHRDIGIVFLFFLLFYFPAHLFASLGLSRDTAIKTFSYFLGFFVIISTHFILGFFWEINKYNSVIVLGTALFLFEVLQKQRAWWRRLRDGLVTLLLVPLFLHVTRDALIRHFILVLFLFSLLKIIACLFSMARRKKDDNTEYFGVLGFYLGLFMFIFSMMMAGGTNSGNFLPFSLTMDHLHAVTSFLFVIIVLVHLLAERKKLLSQHETFRLFSFPVVVLNCFFSWGGRCETNIIIKNLQRRFTRLLHLILKKHHATQT